MPFFVQNVNINVTKLLNITKESFQKRNKNAKIIEIQQDAQKSNNRIVQD